MNLEGLNRKEAETKGAESQEEGGCSSRSSQFVSVENFRLLPVERWLAQPLRLSDICSDAGRTACGRSLACRGAAGR